MVKGKARRDGQGRKRKVGKVEKCLKGRELKGWRSFSKVMTVWGD